jgi:hypothetical protein
LGGEVPAHVARLIAVLIVLSYGAAEAIQQVKSLYTAIDLGACKAVSGGHRDGKAHLCKGLAGYPVYVSEGPAGTYLSFGANAATRQAAQQTLKAFNTLFDKSGRRSTVEWRFVVREQRPVPYATIVRYFTQGATGAGEVLVVTRITDRDACHVAYVDALANEDAIVLARKLADTVAKNGRCPSEPAVHGLAGRSPM